MGVPVKRRWPNIGSRRTVPALGRRRSEGFSLTEVLVTTAIVSAALVALFTILRRQIRTEEALRAHTEARLILDQTAARFQIGDGAEADSLIRGRSGVFSLSFRDAPRESTGVARSRSRDAGADRLPGEERIRRRRIAVSWSDRGREQELSVVAWRFLPKPRASG